MIVLEKRPQPSKVWTAATPVLAVVLTMIAGGLMFAALGKPPISALYIYFIEPLTEVWWIVCRRFSPYS